MTRRLELLLGAESPLSSVLPRFEPRPEQLKMAQAVERALSERSYLLAEAGTGTGKTLAYLVPAVLSGRRVVISTATKTLQEQLVHKDIPLLHEGLRLPFEAAVLKGRQNYLCLERFDAFQNEAARASPDESPSWLEIRDWAEVTTTGDRAELDLPEGLEIWRRLSTTAESCLGSTCPRYQSCFVTRARAHAAEAPVVVVNHHLFFADLALRSGGGGREGVLPDYECVIFDEAHALEDIASDFFGCQVSTWALEELVQDAQGGVVSSREGLLGALGLSLQGRAVSLAEAARIRLGLPESGSVRLGPKGMAGLLDETQAVLEALEAIAAFGSDAEEPALQTLSRRATQLRDDLDLIREAAGTDHVFWAERRGRGVALRAAPIDVAQEMRRRLYSETDTVVFTSGTLTTEGRFDFFEQRLGLSNGEMDRTVRKLRVASPFDYPRQAALYLPSHLPTPNDERFPNAVAEELVALCELSEGRAFALFTSLRNMERVHRLVAPRLPYQVLLQGTRPKRALLEAFRTQPSVLFASHSFWEGVDVPGDALSLVVIDKLPFASPSEPQVAARIDRLRERGEDPFNRYQLPEAALALQQGFGRLIRSREDRGMVAVLDPRISTRAYGRLFVESLPPATPIRSFEALQRWWRGVRTPVPVVPERAF